MPLNIILPSMTTLHKDPHTQFCMHQQSHTCSVNVLVLTHIQITKIRSNFTSLIVHVPIWKMSAPDKFNFTYITIMALQSSVMGNACQLQHFCWHTEKMKTTWIVITATLCIHFLTCLYLSYYIYFGV